MDDYKLEVDKDKQKESKESVQKYPKIHGTLTWPALGPLGHNLLLNYFLC